MNGVKVGETSARHGGGNPELSLGPFFVAVGWSKRVAVGTEETQIFQSVVFIVPVHVVEL